MTRKKAKKLVKIDLCKSSQSKPWKAANPSHEKPPKEIQWTTESDWKANKFKQGRSRRREIVKDIDLKIWDGTIAIVRALLARIKWDSPLATLGSSVERCFAIHHRTFMKMREKVCIQNSMVEFVFWKCTFPDNSNKTVSAVSWGKNLSRNTSRFESLLGYKFNDFTDMSEIPIVPMSQWVEQQGSEALNTGSDPNPYQQFFTKTTVQRDNPPNSFTRFSIPDLSKTEKRCLTNFSGTVRQKIFDRN